MSKRIFFSVFFVSLIVIIVALSTFSGIYYEIISSLVYNELKNESESISMEIRNTDFESLHNIVPNSVLDIRIKLICDNRVIYDSDPNPDISDEINLHKIDELRDAVTEGEGFAYKTNNILSGTRFYAVKISDYEFLHLSTEQHSLIGLIVENAEIILCTFMILVVLSAILSKHVAKKITQPINELNLDDLKVPHNYLEIEPLIVKINDQISQLKQHRDEFDIITKNMNEGILIVNQSGDVLTVNDSALKILRNFTETDISKLNSVHMIEFTESEEFYDTIQKSLSGYYSQVKIGHKNKIYEMLANPIYNDSDLILGSVLILIDITQKEENEKLRREFTSNVSHELKTPLTSIFGYSEIIADGKLDPETCSYFASIIRDESSRLISLVKDIIKLSKFDENKIVDERYPTDLMYLAQDVAARLESLAIEKEVKIILSCESAFVNGVYSLLDEMIYNLVENAIKYNIKNGTVNVGTYEKEDSAWISVSDTGIGIPFSDHERIFERFYRVDKSHSNDVPGTGLGLSIVQHVVNYHNGEITVASIPGEGTIFTVKFPKHLSTT